jgi:two-component system invasion response regulator UvrY
MAEIEGCGGPVPDGLNVVVGHCRSHVRACIRQILVDEGMASTVAEVSNFDELIAVLKNRPWDVIILNTSFAGSALQEQLALVRQIQPSIRCIVISSYPRDLFTLLIGSGANGVVMEENVAEDLVDTVQRVCRGESVFCRGVQEDSVRLTADAGVKPPVSALSSADHHLHEALSGT